MSSAAAHYAEAERLLFEFSKEDNPTLPIAQAMIARAAIHATLAQYGDVNVINVHNGPQPEVTERVSRAAEVARVTARGEFSRVLPLHIPSATNKGPHDTDAQVYRKVATNLDNGYDIGGGNVRAAIATLLRNAATALDVNNQPDPPWSFHGHQHTEAGAR